MTYHVALSNSARRYLKKLRYSGTFNPTVLKVILNCFENGVALPEKVKDHQLQGEFAGFGECHRGFNLLLIYKRNDELGVVTITHIGTHPGLFGE